MRSRELFCIALLAIVAAPGANAAEWTFGPPLNIARSHPGACVASSGDIYVLGGVGPSGEHLNSVEILEFDGTGYANAWLEVAPMTTARDAPAVACVNGFIYAIGGANDTDGTLASVERYDTTADVPSWESMAVPDMNVPRAIAGATVDEWGRIWVIGGIDAATPLSSVEIYDPERPELGWTFGPELNTPRAFAGVVTDRIGRIYAIGGSTFPVHISSVERIDPCDAVPAWVFLPDVPDVSGSTSQSDTAVVGADGMIYVAGGWLPGYTNRVVRFDPNTDTWHDLVPLIQARNNIGLVLGNDGRIFAIGGDFSFSPLTSVEVLDTTPSPGDDDDDSDDDDDDDDDDE